MKRLVKVIMVAIFLLSISKVCLAKTIPSWIPITGNQYNMIIFGKIAIDQVGHGEAGYILYSFGPGGELDCRSKSEIDPDGSYYTTIRGNTAGDIIHFKVYDSQKEEVYNFKDTVTFEIDATLENFDIY